MAAQEQAPRNRRVRDLLQQVSSVYPEQTAWLEEMSRRTPTFFAGFAKLCSSATAEGALPRRIKELMLASIYAARGFSEGAATHLRNAKDAGASDDEIAEMLAATLLSRGTRAYVEGFKAWAPYLPASDKEEFLNREIEGEATTEHIVRYFDEYYGKSLPHVRALADSGHGEVLQAYYEMRSFILNDAVLPRKYKECLYVAINVADGNLGAVKIHGRGALQSGATREEVLEAVIVAIMAGGFIVWVDAAATYEEIVKTS